MKKFRIAKCLDKDGIHEYAIFADGSRKKRVYTDNDYGKYFEVDNELNSEEKTSLKYSFSGRIKDIVDMIRNGNGDCIKSTSLLGKHDYLLYFIDREIGENLRQKSLKGWGNIKFGWSITTGCKCSFSPYSHLNINDECISMFDDDKTPMYFEHKEKAVEHIKNLIEKAWEYAVQLQKGYNSVDDKQEKDKIIDNWIDRIKSETSEFNIVFDYACDMLDENQNLKCNEPRLDEFGWKVVQCIME